ncbi:LacI family DNA-binding transcriptional regulator [Pseudoclavibacter sp. 8L]|uniref:LacI family DNA-binding transcriptional regulator n=1 Tax=Pseudoclavibacter sp. 8L TaxID=2653162 RepID=UPI0012F19F86|nr:LacI family DNA-binding transcriptional regulator [Pseudoclavibacter sp. 8L]VXC44534.1 LacI family transcriptional regulator [Pseudoclavibacter sp. 8L]
MTTAPRRDDPASGRSRTTMKQVASLAGVGVKTVSRVVNNEPNVSATTTERVWNAVRALNYHVDLAAGNLRRADGRSRTIGLLVGSVDNPFAAAIHRAVEDAALHHSVAVFASSLDDDATREEGAVSAFMRRRVDGLILTTTQQPTYLTTLRDRDIPAVFVDRVPPGLDLDAVSSDNQAAAARATTHLINHGHQRIALLTDRLSIQTAEERRRGFLEALGEAGIPTRLATIVTELHDEETSRAALGRLLDSETPPTAVFSSQNLVTIGALRALRERGLQNEIALVGFDDIPLADLLVPGVTVIAQDPQQIGQRAAELLFDRLGGDRGPAQRVTVPTRLIERGSGEILAPAS